MMYIKNIALSLLLLYSAIFYQKEPVPAVVSEPAPVFDHALTLYESGRYEAAAAEADAIASVHKDASWRARARYLAGRAYSSAGVMEKAEESFAAALVELPDMEPYAFYKLATGYEASDNKEKAVEMYLRIAEGHRKSGLVEDALKAAGRLQHDLGQHRMAIKTLGDLMRERPDRDTRAAAHYLLMSSYVSLGAMDSAYFHYMALWKMHPASREMKDAESLLKKMKAAGFKPETPETDDRIERAGGYADYSEYLSAAEELKKALSDIEESDDRAPDVALEAGRMYYNARKTPQAAVMLKKVVTVYPDSTEAPSALYWLARTQLRTGEEDALKLTVEKLEQDFPSHPNTPLVMLLYGSELVSEERYEEAIAVLKKLSDRYPSSTAVDDAMWKLAWAQYLSGEYKDAAVTFGTLSDRFRGGIYEAGGEYWQARSLIKAGEKSRGGKLLEGLAKNYGLSFYGHVANMPDVRYTMYKDESPHVVDALPDPEGGDGDPNLRLAYELGIQRMRADALSVLRKEERRYGATVDGIRKLAGYYAMVDDYRRPLELASDLYTTRLDSGRSPIPEGAMTLVFPSGYWEVIQAESKKYGVDPFLVASLIREESHFDPAAVSPAGAMGLMQMMPSTAAEVCRKLDMSPPTESDLKDGSYNVPLGVCHLSHLIEKHDGRLVYILAEYNAGPGALKIWREKMPDVPDDEFVERIGYRETRNYIKRVMRNYYVYRELYGTPNLSE